MKRKILKLLKQNPGMSARAIAKQLNAPLLKVSMNLNKLVDNNQINKIITKTNIINIKYFLNEDKNDN